MTTIKKNYIKNFLYVLFYIKNIKFFNRKNINTFLFIFKYFSKFILYYKFWKLNFEKIEMITKFFYLKKKRCKFFNFLFTKNPYLISSGILQKKKLKKNYIKKKISFKMLTRFGFKKFFIYFNKIITIKYIKIYKSLSFVMRQIHNFIKYYNKRIIKLNFFKLKFIYINNKFSYTYKKFKKFPRRKKFLTRN